MYKRFIRNRLFRSNTTIKGFTLPELLVAAAISLGVVALGGFGLVSILTSSQAANAQNERRTELNRSLDFI
ncbi:MAG: prepilin-type N-terminal cleavage/methylation domain-containing protein, partial [Acaryochloris sp. SU_5_25]|nr:prepilin-type N-terminal cleavage/methylation domain-containing protein [Acaryochloris sp. SU_5_25]